MADSSEATGAVDVTRAVQEGEGRWSLDPAHTRVEFHVKHFWGLITVRGHFDRVEGEGTVESDGTISGRLVIDAASLTTKNRKRDEHLRSGDFFDVSNHPEVVVSVRELTSTRATALRARMALEAAGHEQEYDVTVAVLAATAEAVTLRSELVVDRSAFAMTWNPLGMASRQARAVVTARLVRA